MGRDDWLALGLERLAAEGPRALLLESLCAAAGRTRGSFYHHFSDHDSFLDALAERWRREDAEALGGLYREPGADRSPLIQRLARRIDPAAELGMRRLGAGNPRIQKILDQVDRQRLRSLTRRHRSRPGVTANQAAAFAWLEYTAYVGSQILWPDAGPDELARSGSLLSECLAVVAADESAAGPA